ncbi:hypothetical protein DMENIID0001_029710 [Sergentomyia squamirostris]
MSEQEMDMDLKSMEDIKRFVEEQAGAEKAEQVASKLQQIMDRLEELPPEERTKYLEQFGVRMKQMKEAVQQQLNEKIQLVLTVNIIVQVVVYAVFLILFLSVIVFIGRKLYRILTERERRKSEKKKVKGEKTKKPKQENGKKKKN